MSKTLGRVAMIAPGSDENEVDGKAKKRKRRHFRPAFESLRTSVKLARYGGSCYAYGQLAAGNVVLLVEGGIQPHDHVAQVTIIEGAGGILTD